eukprot:jgi/Chrzof1/1890/Cz10g25040.t1
MDVVHKQAHLQLDLTQCRKRILEDVTTSDGNKHVKVIWVTMTLAWVPFALRLLVVLSVNMPSIDPKHSPGLVSQFRGMSAPVQVPKIGHVFGQANVPTSLKGAAPQLASACCKQQQQPQLQQPLAQHYNASSSAAHCRFSGAQPTAAGDTTQQFDRIQLYRQHSDLSDHTTLSPAIPMSNQTQPCGLVNDKSNPLQTVASAVTSHASGCVSGHWAASPPSITAHNAADEMPADLLHELLCAPELQTQQPTVMQQPTATQSRPQHVEQQPVPVADQRADLRRQLYVLLQQLQTGSSRHSGAQILQAINNLLSRNGINAAALFPSLQTQAAQHAVAPTSNASSYTISSNTNSTNGTHLHLPATETAGSNNSVGDIVRQASTHIANLPACSQPGGSIHPAVAAAATSAAKSVSGPHVCKPSSASPPPLPSCLAANSLQLPPNQSELLARLRSFVPHQSVSGAQATNVAMPGGHLASCLKLQSVLQAMSTRRPPASESLCAATASAAWQQATTNQAAAVQHQSAPQFGGSNRVLLPQPVSCSAHNATSVAAAVPLTPISPHSGIMSSNTGLTLNYSGVRPTPQETLTRLGHVIQRTLPPQLAANPLIARLMAQAGPEKGNQVLAQLQIARQVVRTGLLNSQTAPIAYLCSLLSSNAARRSSDVLPAASQHQQPMQPPMPQPMLQQNEDCEDSAAAPGSGQVKAAQQAHGGHVCKPSTAAVGPSSATASCVPAVRPSMPAIPTSLTAATVPVACQLESVAESASQKHCSDAVNATAVSDNTSPGCGSPSEDMDKNNSSLQDSPAFGAQLLGTGVVRPSDHGHVAVLLAQHLDQLVAAGNMPPGIAQLMKERFAQRLAAQADSHPAAHAAPAGSTAALGADTARVDGPYTCSSHDKQCSEIVPGAALRPQHGSQQSQQVSLGHVSLATVRSVDSDNPSIGSVCVPVEPPPKRKRGRPPRGAARNASAAITKPAKWQQSQSVGSIIEQCVPPVTPSLPQIKAEPNPAEAGLGPRSAEVFPRESAAAAAAVPSMKPGWTSYGLPASLIQKLVAAGINPDMANLRQQLLTFIQQHRQQAAAGSHFSVPQQHVGACTGKADGAACNYPMSTAVPAATPAISLTAIQGAMQGLQLPASIVQRLVAQRLASAGLNKPHNVGALVVDANASATTAGTGSDAAGAGVGAGAPSSVQAANYSLTGIDMVREASALLGALPRIQQPPQNPWQGEGQQGSVQGLAAGASSISVLLNPAVPGLPVSTTCGAMVQADRSSQAESHHVRDSASSCMGATASRKPVAAAAAAECSAVVANPVGQGTAAASHTPDQDAHTPGLDVCQQDSLATAGSSCSMLSALLPVNLSKLTPEILANLQPEQRAALLRQLLLIKQQQQQRRQHEQQQFMAAAGASPTGAASAASAHPAAQGVVHGASAMRTATPGAAVVPATATAVADMSAYIPEASHPMATPSHMEWAVPQVHSSHTAAHMVADMMQPQVPGMSAAAYGDLGCHVRSSHPLGTLPAPSAHDSSHGSSHGSSAQLTMEPSSLPQVGSSAAVQSGIDCARLQLYYGASEASVPINGDHLQQTGSTIEPQWGSWLLRQQHQHLLSFTQQQPWGMQQHQQQEQERSFMLPSVILPMHTQQQQQQQQEAATGMLSQGHGLLPGHAAIYKQLPTATAPSSSSSHRHQEQRQLPYQYQQLPVAFGPVMPTAQSDALVSSMASCIPAPSAVADFQTGLEPLQQPIAPPCDASSSSLDDQLSSPHATALPASELSTRSSKDLLMGDDWGGALDRYEVVPLGLCSDLFKDELAGVDGFGFSMDIEDPLLNEMEPLPQDLVGAIAQDQEDWGVAPDLPAYGLDEMW